MARDAVADKSDGTKDPKQAKVRLVIFSFGLLEQGGGFEGYVIETAKVLADMPDLFEVTIVTASNKLVERLQRILKFYYFGRHDEASIYRENTDGIRKRLGRANYRHVDSLSELVAVINEHNLLHTKNELIELGILRLIRGRLQPPITIGIHTPVHYPYTATLQDRLHNLLYINEFYGDILRRAAAVKVNTPADVDYLQRRFGLQNMTIVRSAFSTGSARQDRHNGTPLRVLYVGRLNRQKGVGELIRIIEQLRTTPDYQFLFKIAGSGDQAYAAKLRELSLASNNVEYVGHIPSDKVHELYDWADVTVAPSYYETLNRVVAETAAAGKIAVATDIPGPRDLITHGITGYLLPLNVERFVETLVELARMKKSDPELFYAMGMAGRNMLAINYSPEKSLKDTINYFADAAGV